MFEFEKSSKKGKIIMIIIMSGKYGCNLLSVIRNLFFQSSSSFMTIDQQHEQHER